MENSGVEPIVKTCITLAWLSANPVISNRLISLKDEGIALASIYLYRIDSEGFNIVSVDFNYSLRVYVSGLRSLRKTRHTKL